MIAFTKLLRRTAVALSAIAALTVTGLATAQTVTLSGTTTNSCTYSSMTPSGSTLTFTCSNSTGANFAITAPAQLPQNSVSTTDVKVTRTGGLTGALDVALNFGGNCVTTGNATTSTITFTANGSTNLPLATGPVANGACTVQITPVAPGAVTGVNPVSINIVDPDADVVFAFSATDTPASVGNGAVGITVVRTGGTNGTFTVPVTVVTGAGGGTLTVPTGGTLSSTNLAFNSANPVSFTYTAPASNPSGVTLPATMVLALGAPAKVTGASSQQFSSAAGTNTITLSPKSTSCNATVNQIGLADVPTVALPSGGIYTYELPPTSQRKISGTFKLSATTSSFPVAPWSYEMHISKCAGQVDAAVGGTCYISSSNAAQLSLNWFQSLSATAPYNSIAGIQASKFCWAPATEGPWYVNIRYNYADCNVANHQCAWKATWYNYTY